MSLEAALTIVAIVAGPLAAVLITLLVERRRKARETQLHVLRMLISTRHLPSDPTYATAINLVPVEFNRHSAVMGAWNTYIEAVRYQPAQADRESHDAVLRAR